jgi:hypothetical protein
MNIEFPEGMRVGYELEFCSNAPIPLNISRPLLTWFELGVDRSLSPRNPNASMYEIRSRDPLNVVSVDVIQLMLEQLALVNNVPPVPGWRRWTNDDDSEDPVEGPVGTTSDGYQVFTYDLGGTSATSVYEYDTSNTYTTATMIHDNRQFSQRLAARVRQHQNERPRFVPSGKNIFTTRNCGMHVHISWENKRMAHILYGHLARVLTEKVKPFDERKNYCCPDFNSRRGARYNALRWVHTESGHFEVRLFNGTMKLRGIVNNLLMIRNEALLVARASQAAIRTQSANSSCDSRSPAIS